MLGYRSSGEHTAVIVGVAVCEKGDGRLVERGLHEKVVVDDVFIDRYALFLSAYGSLTCRVAGPWLSAVAS
jgi:hypothetical protein